MKYARGKNPNSHSDKMKKNLVKTQLKNKHPWRSPFYFSSNISPDFKPQKV